MLFNDSQYMPIYLPREISEMYTDTYLVHLQNVIALALFILHIAVIPCMLYFNCYVIVGQEPW